MLREFEKNENKQKTVSEKLLIWTGHSLSIKRTHLRKFTAEYSFKTDLENPGNYEVKMTSSCEVFAGKK